MENLRKQVKKLLIDQELDCRGSQPDLAKKLNVHPNSLNMALTGYRQTPGSEKILKDLLELLDPIQKGDGSKL